eukprot:6187028-Pleurochrysis_carterae.AAC.1
MNALILTRAIASGSRRALLMPALHAPVVCVYPYFCNARGVDTAAWSLVLSSQAPTKKYVSLFSRV